MVKMVQRSQNKEAMTSKWKALERLMEERPETMETTKMVVIMR